MIDNGPGGFLRGNFKAIILLLFLVLSLPLVLFIGKNAISLFTHASVTADIKIDAARNQGNLNRVWEGLSQGGEADSNGQLMPLGSTAQAVKDIKIRYIRLDHVMERPSDERIKEISTLGAVPFLALSYFPASAATADVGDVKNWDEWQRQVTAVVEKVSGKNNLNINNVYYEVWNEPDGEGFGKYSVGKDKDYFLLYQKTVEAILRANNVNQYKVGAPALADLRRCSNGLLGVCTEYWLDRFLALVAQSKMRLDFISWHRYSVNMNDYLEDVNFINSIYTKYSQLPSLEKIITEWGSVPERAAMHNSVFDAAHLVAAARTFLGTVDLTTKFEVRDGPGQPDDGWGIIKYDGSKKPTYAAMRFLSLLRSSRLSVAGEGTYVTSIASQDAKGYTFIVVNYDARSRNIETVPIVLSHITPGKYQITKYSLDQRSPLGTSQTTTSTLTDKFQVQELMLTNSIVLYDLQRV